MNFIEATRFQSSRKLAHHIQLRSPTCFHAKKIAISKLKPIQIGQRQIQKTFNTRSYIAI